MNGAPEESIAKHVRTIKRSVLQKRIPGIHSRPLLFAERNNLSCGVTLARAWLHFDGFIGENARR
jgi:hypothetical protein